MTLVIRAISILACCCALRALPATAQTLAAAAAPTPSAAPTPADPCGSILSIVNRPTFGTGVCTVRTGTFDVESGYTNLVSSGAGGGATISYPQSLVRAGTANPHLDLEFSPPSYDRSSDGGTTASGGTDVSFGVKDELGYSARALWGVNGVISAPTGAPAFSAGNPQFTGNLNWGYTLNQTFGLSGTLGFNALSGLNAAGKAQPYFAFVPTLELSAALPGAPSQLSAEIAYFSRSGPGAGSRTFFDFVYARDVGAHVQLDVEYGLSPAPPNGQRERYVGAGLSFMN